ncbi:MAG TPA: hypothetical protein VH084_00685 [Mycobacterium sp.]|jgi:hypothetical protein|nr:hypothetical protein [Mycobacterium sp.]
MTIVEHAPHTTSVDELYPAAVIESHEDPFNAALKEQVVARTPAAASDANPQFPQRQLRLRRLTAIAGGRRHHHPRRERFVEEAVMSREMFRL